MSSGSSCRRSTSGASTKRCAGLRKPLVRDPRSTLSSSSTRRAFTPGGVVWPEGITPLFLPPYSPELQPAEKLWQLLREPLANRLIETLNEVERLMIERCQALYDEKGLIAGCTHRDWWLAADPKKS